MLNYASIRPIFRLALGADGENGDGDGSGDEGGVNGRLEGTEGKPTTANGEEAQEESSEDEEVRAKGKLSDFPIFYNVTVDDKRFLGNIFCESIILKLRKRSVSISYGT